MATHSSVLTWRIPGTGGAWLAAVCGVAQSQTRLKRLSSSSSSKEQLHSSTVLEKEGMSRAKVWRQSIQGKRNAMAMVPKRFGCLRMAGLSVYLEEEEQSMGWWQVNPPISTEE